MFSILFSFAVFFVLVGGDDAISTRSLCAHTRTHTHSHPPSISQPASHHTFLFLSHISSPQAPSIPPCLFYRVSPSLSRSLTLTLVTSSLPANLNTLLFALEQLARPGWLVIEDIHIRENWFPVWRIFQVFVGMGVRVCVCRWVWVWAGAWVCVWYSHPQRLVVCVALTDQAHGAGRGLHACATYTHTHTDVAGRGARRPSHTHTHTHAHVAGRGARRPWIRNVHDPRPGPTPLSGPQVLNLGPRG